MKDASLLVFIVEVDAVTLTRRFRGLKVVEVGSDRADVQTSLLIGVAVVERVHSVSFQQNANLSVAPMSHVWPGHDEAAVLAQGQPADHAPFGNKRLHLAGRIAAKNSATDGIGEVEVVVGTGAWPLDQSLAPGNRS